LRRHALDLVATGQTGLAGVVMKRRFDHAGKSYKVSKERGERLSHTQTDNLVRALLGTENTYSCTGDTMVVVSDGTVYIATLRERIEMDEF